ncbi:MAG: phenylacetic acid degradation protein PaaN [Bacteroidetes bacterium]|nr:phenylacetic acid degradation protein PaaN [Bacteroidota bacterium]
MSIQSQELISMAISAQKTRQFYAAYPENPKAYPEEANQQGLEAFQKTLNQDFTELAENAHSQRVGSEISPYMQVGLGVRYASYSAEDLIKYAQEAAPAWKKTTADQRAAVLVDSLNRISTRFFEIAYATMHTTGQSFVMSFQASGPHANDRALEVVSLAWEELSRFATELDWIKPMGKFDLKIRKTFQAIPRGIGLVIGCSTFPTWNTVPGLYANLMAGNPVIVKPHPKAILPIAIVVAEIQKALQAAGLPANLVQLAPDTLENPITKQLAEHPAVKCIDYTGGSAFGDYIEELKGKTTFTEKAGVNSVILDSVKDADPVFGNIAFSACLYSGQMCTAPQNIFVPENGINTANGPLTFEEVVERISGAVKGLVENPKMGPFTLGAIQNEMTVNRVDAAKKGARVALDSIPVVHPEFPDARMKSPVVMVTEAANTTLWKQECFGPALVVVKTKSNAESLELAAKAAEELGAITCLCYSTDHSFATEVAEQMNAAFTPVSFNFTGAAFVNQHAAFSDFHVTGGNPSGNAGFTNPEYVNKRFVWVGNRYAE